MQRYADSRLRAIPGNNESLGVGARLRGTRHSDMDQMEELKIGEAGDYKR